MFLAQNKVEVAPLDSSDSDSIGDEEYKQFSFKVYNVKHLIMLRDCKELVICLLKDLHRSKQIIFSDFSIYKDYLHEKLIEKHNPEVKKMCEVKKQVCKLTAVFN